MLFILPVGFRTKMTRQQYYLSFMLSAYYSRVSSASLYFGLNFSKLYEKEC
uniref:Uncharacterized protein n=1 Tax=Arundo donax TaxID=35708 RepID=A0A0A9H022_ARUDO